MKKLHIKQIAMLLAVVMVTALLTPCVMAADARYKDSGSGGDVSISANGGKQMQLIGHIEPTIISVTMPTTIPFDISYSLPQENKVVSPQIKFTNNSSVPVTIYVDNNDVNLKELPGVNWAASRSVSSNEISLGFVQSQAEPTNLYSVSWLKEGRQDLYLGTIGVNGSNRYYLAGNIGYSVPENKTFTVSPTLVVRRA